VWAREKNTTIRGLKNRKATMLKVGDKVYVKDGSYSLSIRKGQSKLEQQLIAYPPKQPYIIVALDCDLPGISFSGRDERNNCILSSVNTGDIAFSRAEWLYPVESEQPTMTPFVEFKLREVVKLLAEMRNVTKSSIRIYIG
jgi:hypothetical protein